MKTSTFNLVPSMPLCLILLTIAFADFRLRAEEWPEFRGPTGQGVSQAIGLPVAWGTTENVVWSVRIAGKGWSSPIVVDNRIFLTTAVPIDQGEKQSLRAVCLDAATGEGIWQREIFRPTVIPE